MHTDNQYLIYNFRCSIPRILNWYSGLIKIVKVVYTH